MKLKCDLCGQPLEMAAGGQQAICTCCGLAYSFARLQEKLGIAQNTEPTQQRSGFSAQVPNPVYQSSGSFHTAPYAPPTQIPASQMPKKQIPSEQMPKASVPSQGFEYATPQQLIIQVTKTKKSYWGSILRIEGIVRQGWFHENCELFFEGQRIEPIFSGDFGYLTAGGKVCLDFDNFLDSVPVNNVQTLHGIPVTPYSLPTDAYNYWGSVPDFFWDVLHRNFGDYEICKNVQFNGLLASFGLYKNHELSMVISLIHEADYQNAEDNALCRACKYHGVPFLRFFLEYRNNAAYVANRIRQHLG